MAASEWFDACSAAYKCFLQCGQCIFQHGSRSQISAFTAGMNHLATCSRKDQRDGRTGAITFLQPRKRVGKGEPFYELAELVKVMRVSQHLRSVETLQDAAEAVLALVLGEGSLPKLKLPHSSTISRGKAKLDIALMFSRQAFWEKNVGNVSIQLGYDASTMTKELFVTEESTVELDEAYQAYLYVQKQIQQSSRVELEEKQHDRMGAIEGLSTDLEDEIVEVDFETQEPLAGPSSFSLLRDFSIRKRVLPPITLGRGCTSYEHKVAALLHSITLETGCNEAAVAKYCDSVIATLSDQGTEMLVGSMPETHVESLLADDAECISQAPRAFVAPPRHPEVDDAQQDMDVSLWHAPGGPIGGVADVTRDNIAADRGPVEFPTMCCHEELWCSDRCQQPPGEQDGIRPELNRRFRNALQFLGVKHISDNLLNHSVAKMQSWPEFLEQLRSIERLLARQYAREQFVALCVHDSSDREFFKYWKVKLKGLRWEVVTAFCKEFMKVEEPLRRCWDRDKFNQRRKGVASAESLPVGTNPEYELNVQAIDQAIASPAFWATLKATQEICYEAEFIGRFAEGCICHQNVHDDEGGDFGAPSGSRTRKSPELIEALNCPLRCCRAPEFASGEVLRKLRARMNLSSVWFLQFTAELMSMRQPSAYEQAFTLFRDWMAARARLWGEVVCKLAYFHQLPWCLVGMSHPNKNIAIIAAQHCLRMYNRGGPGIWHRQSQRFLSPTFQGTSDDPALLPYVLKLAGGEDPSGEAMKPLARWLSRFSTIKLAERSVEGIHARLTSVLKRAPNASLAYMSMELRFEDLLRAVASGTDVLLDVTRQIGQIETYRGFKAAVEQLLGIGSPQYLEGMPQHALAKLLYRDDISLKHSNRARLCKELELNKSLEYLAQKDRMNAVKGIPRTTDTPMAELILHHLVEVSLSDPSKCFSVNADLAKFCEQVKPAKGQDMAIEDELNLSSKAVVAQNHAQPQPGPGSGYVFFRLVDKSFAASLTFLGDTAEMQNVDFIAQPFETISVNGLPAQVPASALLASSNDVVFAKWLAKPDACKLLSSILIWEYQPRQQHSISFLGLSTEEEQLLLKMIEVGAAGSDSHGLFLSEDEAALSALKNRRFVRPMVLVDGGHAGPGNDDWYTLTDTFRSLIRTGLRVHHPIPIMEYCRPNKDVSDMTALELVALLAKAGWKDRCAKSAKSKSVVPFSVGSEKIWFRRPTAPISKLYLQVLAKSSEMLKSQESIHHFQPANYYKALLAGCSHVLCNQPLPYYKKIMAKGNSGQASGRRKRATVTKDAQADIDDGLDERLVQLQHSTQQPAPRQRQPRQRPVQGQLPPPSQEIETEETCNSDSGTDADTDEDGYVGSSDSGHIFLQDECDSSEEAEAAEKNSDVADDCGDSFSNCHDDGESKDKQHSPPPEEISSDSSEEGMDELGATNFPPNGSPGYSPSFADSPPVPADLGEPAAVEQAIAPAAPALEDEPRHVEKKTGQKRHGWTKRNVSPKEILALISPLPHCKLSLGFCDHRWHSTWTEASKFEGWSPEFARLHFSRVFDVQRAGSWKEALRQVHERVWAKWMQASASLPLDSAVDVQVPGEIPNEVWDLLDDVVSNLEPRRQYYVKQ